MIALLDYGAGNLTSVRKGLAAVGAEFFTPTTPDDLAAASGIIIPGVGHFAALRAIDAHWREAILASVERRTPLFGICLGLQYLFDGSDEAPEVRGLGFLPGRITRLPPTLKVPHVGWNALTRTGPSVLLDGIADEAQVYFTHSYAAPVTDACVASTTHSATFASAVERGHIFGVQFHPEKSSDAGLRILRSFVEITKSPNPAFTGSPACSPDA
ncbi:MAG TPA: imidazole glycerol phosphate synthase subunit HisH [Vicinamibacterales bacterium]|jgi:glutamine amidotransferase|nr:imidazole glycerol phosphate synthase subunit HisH [Vicinamibacterales bacterium]